MKAVIMAGGEGTRLRPITCNMPKPLVPLCTKPVLSYILELLAEHGCTDATLTLMYLGRSIEAYYDGDSYQGISLHYSYEDTPLGTAGSVKNAVPAAAEPFLIISGDAMCDFDLTAAMAYHKQKGAAATLIVKKVTDPREYGLVNLGQDGRIAGFVEKPPLSHCITDLANTGVYILSPEVLDLIPPGKKVDFAGDVFPAMLEKGMPLFAYEDRGYWCDIGDIRSYQRCQRDMLEGKVRCAIPAKNQDGIYSNTDLSALPCRIVPPAFIGENVSIGEGTVITDGTVIGNNVTIGSGCKLRGAVLQDHCYLSDMVTCNEAVVCADARMSLKSAAYEQAVLGEGAVLGKESRLLGGVKLWNKKETADNVLVGRDVKYGGARSIVIDDDGISGETNVSITPELMARIGASVGSLKAGCTIGVASSHTGAGIAFRQAFDAGAVAAGANVFDFGEAIETEFDFCLRRSQADFGVYIDSNIITDIKISERYGAPMMRALERKLESAVNRSEYRKSGWNEFGVAVGMPELKKLYRFSLIKEAKEDLSGMSVQIKCANSRAGELLSDILKKLGCGVRGGMALTLSSDGRRLSAYTPESGYLFSEKLLCLNSLAEFMEGRDAVVPYEAPAAIERIAQRYGRRVLRYYASPCDGSDAEARRLAADTLFLRDGLMHAVRLLAFLKKHGLTLAEAASLLPEFEVSTRLVGIHGSPAAIMRHFQTDSAIGEGVAVENEKGRVLLRPVKSGRGIMLFAESVRSETASELCDLFEKKIHESEADS